MDCLFKNIDSNHDNAIDMKDWLHSVIDDCKNTLVKYLSLEVNPLQIMRDVITKYNLTGDDLLYRM